MEAPYLQKVHQKNKNRGGVIMGVAVEGDEIDSLKQFIKRNKVNYPITLDVQGRVYDNFSLPLPSSILIDRSGIIRMIEKGFEPKKFTVAQRRFESLLAKTNTKVMSTQSQKSSVNGKSR